MKADAYERKPAPRGERRQAVDAERRPVAGREPEGDGRGQAAGRRGQAAGRRGQDEGKRGQAEDMRGQAAGDTACSAVPHQHPCSGQT
jgi:hypothetical protein